MICLHISFAAALLGSVSFRAAESCQHIIQSVDSTGSGEYWVDPQGNGNSFKASCDMTTDGGLFSAVFFFFLSCLYNQGFFFNLKEAG